MLSEVMEHYIIAFLAFACFVALLILIGILSLQGGKTGVPEQLWTMAQIALGGVIGAGAATAQNRQTPRARALPAKGNQP